MRVTLTLVLLLLVASQPLDIYGQASGGGVKAYYVRFKSGTTAGKIAAAESALLSQGTKVSEVASEKHRSVISDFYYEKLSRTQYVEVPSKAEAALLALKSNPNVEFVEEIEAPQIVEGFDENFRVPFKNPPMSAGVEPRGGGAGYFSTNDPGEYPGSLQRHTLTCVDGAHAITTGNPAISIAIFDNGFKTGQTELNNKVVYAAPGVYNGQLHGTGSRAGHFPYAPRPGHNLDNHPAMKQICKTVASALAAVAIGLLNVGQATAQAPAVDTCLYVELQPVWTYKEWAYPCQINLSQVRYVADTMVGNRLASVLARFDPANIKVAGSDLIAFYRGGILEVYGDTAWTTIYDLSIPLAPGDTVAFDFPANALSYDVAANQATGFGPVSHFTLYSRVFERTPSLDLSALTTGRAYTFGTVMAASNSAIIDLQVFTPGVGSSAGFFGQAGPQAISECAAELVCFQTQDSSYSIGLRGCALLSGLSAAEQSLPGLRILPNPAAPGGCLRVAGLLPEHALTITSTNGQAVAFTRDGDAVCLSRAHPPAPTLPTCARSRRGARRACRSWSRSRARAS